MLFLLVAYLYYTQYSHHPEFLQLELYNYDISDTILTLFGESAVLVQVVGNKGCSGHLGPLCAEAAECAAGRILFLGTVALCNLWIRAFEAPGGVGVHVLSGLWMPDVVCEC